jgi:hypothetical protein
MKCKFFLCVCFIVISIFTTNAQQTIDVKKAKELKNALNAAKITGKISYPKSIGSINDFVNKVKTGTTVFSYKMENGQLTDRKTVSVSQITVTSVTSSNTLNYEFDFIIEAVFPFDRPIDVVINDWCYKDCGGLGGSHIVFTKVSASEYATLSSSDKIYEGFNFKGESKNIPY